MEHLFNTRMYDIVMKKSLKCIQLEPHVNLDNIFDVVLGFMDGEYKIIAQIERNEKNALLYAEFKRHWLALNKLKFGSLYEMHEFRG